MLGQEAVEDRSNEITASRALQQRLDLEGALVSIDAMGCNRATAEAIIAARADYLLAAVANQPALHAELEAYFDTAPEGELDVCATLDKSRGRIERRTCTVSRTADWRSPINPDQEPWRRPDAGPRPWPPWRAPSG